jgi:endonuclease/exonuclease/phosphatase family metal-dependent hydrolase
MRRLLLVAFLCLAWAVGPVSGGAAAAETRALGAPTLTAMTRNLFLGTGFEPILSITSPTGLFAAVAQLWANVQATDFRQRAVALAAEVERTRPDVIGLQEAVLWRTQSPSDFTATPATAVAYDFVELLLAELERHGLRYRAVAIATNSDFEFPVTYLAIDVRLTDRDAILVREGLAFTNADVRPFQAALNIPNPYLALSVPRSWQSVDVVVDGQTVRVANTHLEPTDAAVQTAQGQELLAGLAASPYPALLLGDFNSKADRSGTPTYGTIADAGYTDAWSTLHPGEPGFTCCHATSLMNPTPTLDERIDIVFARGLEPLTAEIVGEEPTDRTASGLWPSDHAGVVASFGLPVADTEVAVELRSVAVTRARVVKVRLDLDEGASLRLELRRKGKLLASKEVATLEAGLRTVALAIPRRVGPGSARVRIRLEDEADNVLVLTRGITVPALA